MRGESCFNFNDDDDLTIGDDKVIFCLDGVILPFNGVPRINTVDLNITFLENFEQISFDEVFEKGTPFIVEIAVGLLERFF